MPKRGQNREHLSTELQEIVSENVKELMGNRSPKSCAEGTGISYKVFERLRSGENTTIATLEAVAKSLGVLPFQLLMKGSLRKVFGEAAPDNKLGSGWTRPDRAPLLQSGSVKSSTKRTKIISR